MLFFKTSNPCAESPTRKWVYSAVLVVQPSCKKTLWDLTVLFGMFVDDRRILRCQRKSSWWDVPTVFVLIAREYKGREGGGTLSSTHTDTSISALSPCLSAVAGVWPVLRQLDFINIPAPSDCARCSAILTNDFEQFVHPLRTKSSDFANNI